MRTVTTLLMIALLGASCVKDELKDLTYNPFDPAYDGPPLFSLHSSTVEEILTPEGLDRRLTQRIRMERNLLLRNTTFTLECVRITGGSGAVNVPSNELLDGYFDLVTNFSQQGAEYCWEIRLTNLGSIGARNDVCGT